MSAIHERTVKFMHEIQPPEPPRRRQNKACNSCANLRRKCVLLEDGACERCKRLQQPCLFTETKIKSQTKSNDRHTSCYPCHGAKAKCDCSKGHPCVRCSEKELGPECLFPDPSQRYQRIIKSCGSCRQAKLRCDLSEGHYPCTRCRRKGLECLRPEQSTTERLSKAETDRELYNPSSQPSTGQSSKSLIALISSCLHSCQQHRRSFWVHNALCLVSNVRGSRRNAFETAQIRVGVLDAWTNIYHVNCMSWRKSSGQWLNLTMQASLAAKGKHSIIQVTLIGR